MAMKGKIFRRELKVEGQKKGMVLKSNGFKGKVKGLRGSRVYGGGQVNDADMAWVKFKG